MTETPDGWDEVDGKLRREMVFATSRRHGGS